jgi:flagellar basal-body rod protein FlgB
MLENLNILKMASAMARYAAHRHQQLSENVANADTSHYRAKDLEPFAEAYARLDLQKNETGGGALQAAQQEFARTIEIPGVESPNGNTVSLEDQMMRTIEAQQDHQAATLLYKKTIGILRMTLQSGA